MIFFKLFLNLKSTDIEEIEINLHNLSTKFSRFIFIKKCCNIEDIYN